MSKKRFFIWDYLAWVILLAILIWLILKATGIISTPNLIEYAPFFGAVYLAGWAMHKLNRATEDIRDVKREVRYVEKDIELIRQKCPVLLRR